MRVGFRQPDMGSLMGECDLYRPVLVCVFNVYLNMYVSMDSFSCHLIYNSHLGLIWTRELIWSFHTHYGDWQEPSNSTLRV